ncbi:hypothetical protein, partial [Pseudomonas sp. FW305-124]|uniref:hypothetical protein n=1 Tax=Pseudomonas sp. FW305-124 TaxID=2070649 RepID=UPI001C482E36
PPDNPAAHQAQRLLHFDFSVKKMEKKRGQIYFPETHSLHLKELVNPNKSVHFLLPQAMTKASSEGRRFCNKQI